MYNYFEINLTVKFFLSEKQLCLFAQILSTSVFLLLCQCRVFSGITVPYISKTSFYISSMKISLKRISQSVCLKKSILSVFEEYFSMCRIINFYFLIINVLILCHHSVYVGVMCSLSILIFILFANSVFLPSESLMDSLPIFGF